MKTQNHWISYSRHSSSRSEGLLSPTHKLPLFGSEPITAYVSSRKVVLYLVYSGYYIHFRGIRLPFAGFPHSMRKISSNQTSFCYEFKKMRVSTGDLMHHLTNYQHHAAILWQWGDHVRLEEILLSCDHSELVFSDQASGIGQLSLS